jgi:hypothetical protein
VGVAKLYDGEKAWSSINHSIFYSLAKAIVARVRTPNYPYLSLCVYQLLIVLREGSQDRCVLFKYETKINGASFITKHTTVQLLIHRSSRPLNGCTRTLHCTKTG